ncbi:hypothetical protein [Streptomyces antibioticus]|uniref:hypothetical protein n=1 Tax=Streptomyces antibioticus TaxID=1890 RepID=UPI003D721E17
MRAAGSGRRGADLAVCTRLTLIDQNQYYFRGTDATEPAARLAVEAPAGHSSPVDRVRVSAIAAAVASLLRFGLREEGVLATARGLVPPSSAPCRRRSPKARRTSVSPAQRVRRPPQLQALDTALGLLGDYTSPPPHSRCAARPEEAPTACSSACSTPVTPPR